MARIAKGSIKHGGCPNGKASKLWNVWYSMINRCRNPKNQGFKYYGGKGITVCEQWNDFSVFREWMSANGYQPGLSIDRRDTSLGYQPDNCHLIPTAENCANGIKVANENRRQLRDARLAIA